MADKTSPAPSAAARDGSAPPNPAHGRLSGHRITLCVTGSIAAFKAPCIVRLLCQAGAEVFVVLSRSAREFIGPATFSGLTGRPVIDAMFGPHVAGEPHLQIASSSSLLLIAPATADVLARLAAGQAGDTITAAALCARSRVMLAPAMHPAMWQHPATTRNVRVLDQEHRVEFVGPVLGEVATGEIGVGRMADPEQIVDRVLQRLAPSDLDGRHVVITAGPTLEDLDPVRFLGNRSTGKMGFALAERAARRGARVTLVAGPVALSTPHAVCRVDVRSAEAMREAVWEALGPDLTQADALIMAAAVADYRPAERSETKLRRTGATRSLDLVQNPDILAEIGQRRPAGRPVLVGFALETADAEQVVRQARDKLLRKRVDVVVANHASDALGRDDNRATLVTPTHQEPLGQLPKTSLADRILDWLASRWGELDRCC